MKRLALVAVAMLAVVLAIAALAAWRMLEFLDAPVSVAGDGVTFEIAPGAAFGSIASGLESRGIIASARMLRIYARWTDQAERVQAGEYYIAAASSPRALLQQFTRGAVRLYSFTIIEGWNRWDLLRALRANDTLQASMTDEDWPALLEELGA